MFDDVKLLIAEEDADIRTLWERCAEGMGFSVRSVAEIRHGLDALPNYDILLMDLKLMNGPANILLNRWIQNHGRPVCVFSEFLNPALERELILTGAWNVLRRPCPIELLQAVLFRYGQYVLNIRQWSNMKTDVSRLKKLNIILFVLAAAALGERLIPFLAKLL